MNLKGIHHVSLNVKDVEAANHFYVDVLGLEVLDRPDLGFPGTWLTTGLQEIHLLGIESGEPVKQQHFAFLVDDLEAIRAELDAALEERCDPDIAWVVEQALGRAVDHGLADRATDLAEIAVEHWLPFGRRERVQACLALKRRALAGDGERLP